MIEKKVVKHEVADKVCAISLVLMLNVAKSLKPLPPITVSKRSTREPAKRPSPVPSALLDKPLPSPPIATVVKTSDESRSRSLVDAFEEPLQRRAPNSPERLEEWPTLYPRKPTSPERLRTMQDGELEILDQLMLSNRQSKALTVRSDRTGTESVDVRDDVSTGTVVHKNLTPSVNISEIAAEDAVQELEDLAADNAAVEELRCENKDAPEIPSGEAGQEAPAITNGTNADTMRIETPKFEPFKPFAEKLQKLSPLATNVSSMEKSSATKELPSIRHTRASALRASLVASRSADNSPTAVALDMDGPHPRPIRGTRIPSKTGSDSTPEASSQKEKVEAPFQNRNTLVKDTEDRRSGTGLAKAVTPAVRVFSDGAKALSSGRMSSSSPSSATLPRSSLPKPNFTQKGQSALDRPSLVNATANSSTGLRGKSLFQKKSAKKSIRDVFEPSPANKVSTVPSSVNAMTVSDCCSKGDRARGRSNLTTKSSVSSHVRSKLHNTQQPSIKRLSQANPEHGPTLKIYPSAERLLMGDVIADNEEAMSSNIEAQQSQIVDGAEDCSPTKSGIPDMKENASPTGRDAMKKKLQSVANRAEKRSNSKRVVHPPGAINPEASPCDRVNKFHRELDANDDRSQSSHNGHGDPRKPLPELPLTTMAVMNLQEDPFFEAKRTLNGEQSNDAEAALEDLSDIAIPGKEANWISPVSERRASLIRRSIATSMTSPLETFPEQAEIPAKASVNAGAVNDLPKNGSTSSSNRSSSSKGSSKSGLKTKLPPSPTKTKLPPSPSKRMSTASSVFPARKSSRAVVVDYTKTGSAKNSPAAPLFQHNPPKSYVDRQNRLGKGNGLQSIEKYAETDHQASSVSKRASVAELSSKSYSSVSRNVLKRLRNLVHKSKAGSETFRADRGRHNKDHATSGSSFAKPTISSAANTTKKLSERTSTSIANEDSPHLRGKDKKLPPRPTILPHGSGSPFPHVSDVHPVHRPQLHSATANAPILPRISRRKRTSSAPAKICKGTTDVFGSQSSTDSNGSPTKSGLRRALAAWPLPRDVDPLSAAGLRAAHQAQQDGTYTPRSAAEIDVQLGSCSTLAQELLAQARAPFCPAAEYRYLLRLAQVIVEALKLTRQANVAAEDAERAAFSARCAYDLCARNVGEVAAWAREWRSGLPQRSSAGSV